MTSHAQGLKATFAGVIQRHWSRVVLVVVLVLVVAARLRLLDLPLERDEGEYAYAGQLILEGVPPYKLVYNMKFPGTYFAYALIMLVFGQTPAAIHLGLTCLTTLTALMLYWFGRKLVDEIVGVVAATTYAVLAASPATLGLAAHATHFAAFFVTAGLCVLWPAQKHLSWQRVATGGLMFGLATLMKQHAALFCLWGLWFVGTACWRREISRTARAGLMTAFCLGTVTPLLICCIILWWTGVLDQFVFWTINYAFEYARIVPLSRAPEALLRTLEKFAQRDLATWLVVVVGFGGVLADGRFAQIRARLLLFFGAAILTTVAGFYFRRHYFILVLPAAALLAGCGVGAARAFLARKKTDTVGALAILAYLLIIGFNVKQNSDIWFRATPAQATRKIYFGNPFAESEPIADYIRTNSAPDAKVAILGSEPQIFFLAKRRSATGYIYTYPLMEPHAYADQMHRQMIHEIESAKPEFVLFVAVSLSWLPWPESNKQIFDWWANSYRTNYTLVGVAVMRPPHDTQYFWGQAAVEFGEQLRWGVLVYRRTTP